MFTINILLPGHPVVRVSPECSRSSLASYLSGCGCVSQKKKRHSVLCPRATTQSLPPQPANTRFGSQLWEKLPWERFCNERKGNTKVIPTCQYVLLQLLFVSIWRRHNNKAGFMTDVFQMNIRKQMINRNRNSSRNNRNLSFCIVSCLNLSTLIPFPDTTTALRCSPTMICSPSTGPRWLKVTKPASVWRTPTAQKVSHVLYVCIFEGNLATRAGSWQTRESKIHINSKLKSHKVGCKIGGQA